MEKATLEMVKNIETLYDKSLLPYYLEPEEADYITGFFIEIRAQLRLGRMLNPTQINTLSDILGEIG